MHFSVFFPKDERKILGYIREKSVLLEYYVVQNYNASLKLGV